MQPVRDLASRGKFWAAKGAAIWVGIAILVLWDVAVRVFELPWYALPPPSQVAVALYNGLIAFPLEKGDLMYRGAYYFHAYYTLAETFIGWIGGSLIGIFIAVLLYQFKFAERVFVPYISATQALPKIAIAPVFMIWLGLGIGSKIALVLTTAFFPVMINTLLGFQTVPAERVDLMRSLGASRAQIYRMVIFPSALPSMLAGVELALLFSYLAAVAAEFVGAGQGLGLLVVVMGQMLDMAGLFSILVLMAILGWSSDTAVRKITRKVCFWAEEEQQR
ncbi:ABC transporter permease [Chloroflexota bacterium]